MSECGFQAVAVSSAPFRPARPDPRRRPSPRSKRGLGTRAGRGVWRAESPQLSQRGFPAFPGERRRRPSPGAGPDVPAVHVLGGGLSGERPRDTPTLSLSLAPCASGLTLYAGGEKRLPDGASFSLFMTEGVSGTRGVFSRPHSPVLAPPTRVRRAPLVPETI